MGQSQQTSADSPVIAAAEHLRDVLIACRGSVSPYDPNQLATLESEYGQEFPQPWHEVLTRCGGPSELPWPMQGFSMCPDDTLDQMNDSPDTGAILGSCRMVLGYAGDSNNCVTIDLAGDDPNTYYHEQGSREDNAIGPLSVFLQSLAYALSGRW